MTSQKFEALGYCGLLGIVSKELSLQTERQILQGQKQKPISNCEKMSPETRVESTTKRAWRLLRPQSVQTKPHSQSFQGD